MAKSCQYKITKDGHTYILTGETPKTTSTTGKIPHIHLNQCVSLCLVCPIPPNNNTHIIPQAMNSLLQEFFDVFQTPTGLPPSRHIDHSIHLILGSALPITPTYRLAPRETEEMEKQLTDLINSSHIQPSSAPCSPTAFVI